jgi:hypothetical protein
MAVAVFAGATVTWLRPGGMSGSVGSSPVGSTGLFLAAMV